MVIQKLEFLVIRFIVQVMVCTIKHGPFIPKYPRIWKILFFPDRISSQKV